MRETISAESKQNLNLIELCVVRALELLIEEETTEEQGSGGWDDNGSGIKRNLSICSSDSSSAPSSPSRRMSKTGTNTKRVGRGSVNADLSHLRKQFEKASLAKVIARQLRQSINSANTNNTNNVHVPKPNFINLQMISDLIEHRHVIVNKINEKLFSLFDKATGKEYQQVDELWRRTLKLSLSSCSISYNPIGPIVGLLNHPNHPISQISRDFALRLKFILSPNTPTPTTNQTSSTQTALEKSQQICEEYHQFSYEMTKLLRNNYSEELSDTALILPLQISIESYFFSHLPALSTGILKLFTQINAEADKKFLEHAINLIWLNFDHEDALFAALGIPDKYRMSNYDTAVVELRHLSSITCPTAKALSLVRVCDLICTSVEQDQVEGAESAIGSEDLVLLLSWIIIQAQVPDIFTQFAIMSEFLPEDLIRCQAGYVLATVQTCLDFIQSI